MRDTDLAEFSELLDGVCSLLSRGAYAPSSTNMALFFRALARYRLADVRAALDAHVADPQRGRFVPVPADVIAQIDRSAADDGRPGPEEAWAIALRAADEAETVVWTQDIAQAWHVARTVLDAGDEVGARMAFREAYARIVSEVRARRVSAKWVASLGFDAQRRDAALTQAAEAGRIDAPILPAPRSEQPFLALVSSPFMLDATRASLAALRERLTAAATDAPSPDSIARADTAARQADTSRRVDEYLAQKPEAA